MSDPIVTVNPDDLAERPAASDDLFALVCSAGGPLQRLAFDKLLAKLITTNLCKATSALLTADLAHDADSVALVFNDPTALSNGWWRKTGASGAGAWVQFEILATALRDQALQAVADAEAAALNAQSYAAAIPAATGIGSADVAPILRGVVTPTASAASAASGWSTGKAFPYDGTMTCRIRCTVAGTYTCVVADMATRKPLKIFTGIALGSGLTTVGAAVFGDYIRPAGTITIWDQTAGSGGICYNAGGGALSTTTQVFVLGEAVNAFASAAVTLAIEETVQAASSTLNRRVALLERATAGWGRLRPRVTGTLTLASSQDAANTSLFYEPLSTDPCILDTYEWSMTGAGWGYVAIDIRNGDGTVSPYMIWPVEVAAGDNIVDFKGLALPAGAMVAYRGIVGTGPKYQNNIGHCFSRSILTTGIGETAPLASTQARIAQRATLREPTRRKRVFPRRAYGPVQVVSETFPGTGVTPDGWTLGSAFSVADGLVMSGAGAWNNVATFNAGGGRSSSISKRLIPVELTVTDPTWIGGPCTQVQSANGSAGVVATVDCPAGKLYLHSWTGAATAGETRTAAEAAAGAPVGNGEAALPASTLAAIAASSTSIPLVVKLEKNGATVIATAIDPVTQNTTTITQTLSAATQSAFRLMHGRPGMMHRQGSAKVKRFSAYHNVPYDCGTAMATDSNGEGIYGDTLNTWAQQAVAASPRVVLSARGSATTAEMLERADDILSIRADRWVFALGTNEASQATWRVNMATLHDLARATGAEVIMTTFMPNENPGAQTLMNALNADVIGNYFGALRYIDLAAATSSGNARTAWNATFKKNLNHANQAGQNASFAQALINVPELLL